MPSLRHELGLMFGFLSLCIVVIGAYVALWRGELSSSSYLYINTKIYKSVYEFISNTYLHLESHPNTNPIMIKPTLSP